MSHDTYAHNDATPDNALVALAARGDESAFEELHRRHRRLVIQVCMMQLHNVEDAEDAAQETFIQLHRKLGTFRGESSFKTWLHRIALNQARTIVRRRSASTRRPELSTLDGDIELADQLHPSSPAPDFCLRMTLDAFAAGMPRREREVFVMKAVMGYGHEQIAAALDIEEGTSKSQFSRARARLRLTLAGTPGAPPHWRPAAAA